ncbi:MAG: RES family NAD+ phosphorylase [Sandaracinaceae bacterium]
MAWAAGLSSAVLSVPSAVVPEERNYLVNPVHPDFGRIVTAPPVPVTYDPRLFT